MFSLHKGDCEHCSLTYRYMLLHAGFGDFSFAYCDACGTLAALSYTNKDLVNLPPARARNEEIEAAWEPHLRPAHAAEIFARGLPRVAYTAIRRFPANAPPAKSRRTQ